MVYDYRNMRRTRSERISQTVDRPIMILDFWDIGDAGAALAALLVFGVILNEWIVMTAILAFFLLIGPSLKSKYGRGIYYRWPYRYLGFTLPGLVRPAKSGRFSD